MRSCCKDSIHQIFDEIDRRLDESRSNCVTNDLFFPYETQNFRNNLREIFDDLKLTMLEKKALEDVHSTNSISTSN